MIEVGRERSILPWPDNVNRLARLVSPSQLARGRICLPDSGWEPLDPQRSSSCGRMTPIRFSTMRSKGAVSSNTRCKGAPRYDFPGDLSIRFFTGRVALPLSHQNRRIRQIPTCGRPAASGTVIHRQEMMNAGSDDHLINPDDGAAGQTADRSSCRSGRSAGHRRCFPCHALAPSEQTRRRFRLLPVYLRISGCQTVPASRSPRHALIGFVVI